jgi:hypothetical protein
MKVPKKCPRGIEPVRPPEAREPLADGRAPGGVNAASNRKKINIQIGYGARNAIPIKSLLVGM